MKKVRIITDSNSGITQQEAKELDITVFPMPFSVNGKEYLEDITITQEEFYKLLESGTDVKTSQPSQYDLEQLWDNLLSEYEQILYIPMSSGLSGTCESAKRFAEKYGGKVLVVDNKRISVTQKESVFEAIKMLEKNIPADKIKQYLEQSAHLNSVYIMLDVLKYLKKGGRISPSAAAIGDMLKVKPILFSNGMNFEKAAMALSVAQARKKMINLVKQDLENKFKNEYAQGKMTVSVAHTQNQEEALRFKKEIQTLLPELNFRFVAPLSLSVSCHIGPGSLAIAIAVDNYLE